METLERNDCDELRRRFLLERGYHQITYSSANNADGQPPLTMEETELYRLISRNSRASMMLAWRLIGALGEDDIQRRSDVDGGTYLHHLVNQAPETFRKYGDVNHLVPIVYRLALRGVVVNARNEHGNTCLHLACLRPNAERLCAHLIRIGVDPCIQNDKDCRVIHTYRNHACQLVKGQKTAKSGLWNAVEREDVGAVERLLKSWCRVDVRKNKSLRGLAEETSNVRLIRLLESFESANEIVCAAFAVDCERVRSIIKHNRLEHVVLSQKDESCEVPKPLLVALQELGSWTEPVIKALQDLGCLEAHDYEAEFKEKEVAFENSRFFRLIEEGSEESVLQALDLILTNDVDVTLRSNADDTKGWTYFHYVVDRYLKMKRTNEERSRLLVSALYGLTLAGVDVNARDARSETALVKGASGLDQVLLNRLVRLGCDASLPDARGRCVSEEVYENRGKLIFSNKYRVSELPGLWAAVRNNDVAKAERWLRSWSRVNNVRGDRKLIEIAQSMGHVEIVKLLESYEHINEFVSATFASDLKKMMDILALGSGNRKVNTIDDFFHVGYTWNHYAEFIPRPIIISAFEICTASVVDFLLNFGSDLSKQYEESAPCGPTAFWAFRDHVSNEIANVVAEHVDIKLRDEIGCTLLHRIVQKNRSAGKTDVISVLLDRGVDVAARDYQGSTARDYIDIYNIENGDEIRQMIDDFVLELVNADQPYKLESLLLDSYDHIVDIRGMKRMKTAQEIAELKQYDQVLRFLREHDKYRDEIDLLQEAAKQGDLVTISKLSGERRCAWARDKAGRTLLHNALLYGHAPIVKFLVEQHHHLLNSRDNLNRTPLHFCVCLKDRQHIWPILQECGAEQNLLDANNMSVYDYVRQLESPTPKRNKPRGRRWRDYKPSELVEFEKNMRYGLRTSVHAVFEQLKAAIEADASSADIQKITDTGGVDAVLLVNYNMDVPLLSLCIALKREQLTTFFISECSFRQDADIQVVPVRDKDRGNETAMNQSQQVEETQEPAALIENNNPE